VGFTTPYDHETIERFMLDVKPLVQAPNIVIVLARLRRCNTNGARLARAH
jgi:hypothetical protein